MKHGQIMALRIGAAKSFSTENYVINYATDPKYRRLTFHILDVN